MSLHILGLSWLDEDARYATNNDVTSENGIMISYRQWLFLLNAAQCTAKAMKEPNAANHQGCVCFLAGLARGLSEKQESSARRPVAASAGSNLQHESQIHSHPSECSVSANETSSSPNPVSKDARTDSHSETGNKTVAQPAFELSVEELLKIIDGYIPEALKIRAINEIKRRSGEDEASS